MNINMFLPVLSDDSGYLIELYKSGINYIMSGPNFYCYLNKAERKDFRDKNILRKKKRII